MGPAGTPPTSPDGSPWATPTRPGVAFRTAAVGSRLIAMGDNGAVWYRGLAGTTWTAATGGRGNMLGMDRILEKIRGKFGETLSVNESDMLKKAFGSDEAVSLIKLMLTQTGDLKQNIADLGQVNNMDKAK